MKNKLENQKRKGQDLKKKNEKSKILKKGIVLFLVQERKRITFIVN
jgi:hypothetical protein